MKTAFSVWNGRIAPVFDASQTVLIITGDEEALQEERFEAFECDDPRAKVQRLVAMGVDSLVCGAISRPLACMIEAAGISLNAFIAGELQAIKTAHFTGGLRADAFSMPGCCRRGRGRGFGGGCGLRQGF